MRRGLWPALCVALLTPLSTRGFSSTPVQILTDFTVDVSGGTEPVDFGALIADGNGNLYGTTVQGGARNIGTLFKIAADGTGFVVLHSFLGGAQDAGSPNAGLNLDGGGNLYGTTFDGPGGAGTVFKIGTDGTGFTLLHSFQGPPGDGAYPVGGLVLDTAGILYGTTTQGGVNNFGTVFAVTANGTDYSVLHSFAGYAGDGAFPYTALVLDGSGNLYGTTYGGGASGYGTVFKIAANGTGFAVLHFFVALPSDGVVPFSGLVLDGSGTLYGTTFGGGANGGGTVFKIATDGTEFGLLHSFVGGPRDGEHPYAGLILDGSGNLYGTTYNGGASDFGIAFTVTTNGVGFSLLHSFAGGPSDGQYPYAGLTLDGSGHLYGTTYLGGAHGGGAVFEITTGGSAFTVLHSFAGVLGDGDNPVAGLVLDGNGNLYGTTAGGGASLQYGTVFRIGTNGSGFTILHSFAGGSGDGGGSLASLVLDGNGTLYGTTSQGGTSGFGTVFSIGTDGSGFTILHSFAGGSGDGEYPYAHLVYDGSGTLYGTTYYGGLQNEGTIFSVGTDGTGFSVLHSFFGGSSDGSYPRAPLALDSAGNLYGTTFSGGVINLGTAFMISTSGANFQVLHSFEGGSADGAVPYSGLTLDGTGNLYGTTFHGGPSDAGTVFTITSGCSVLTILRSFDGGSADGAFPTAGLLLDTAGNLYGTTNQGPITSYGTVFKIRTDGTGYKLLHSFAGGSGDGASPNADLILDGSGNLYGTTSEGGANRWGTVFKLFATCGSLAFTPQSLPGGTVGFTYRQAITASGGTPPVGYTLVGGHLPPGLTISSTGVISGTPTLLGICRFVIRAVDARGCSSQQKYSIVINPR